MSLRIAKPNALNLDGIFANLPNNAWTNFGPIDPEELDAFVKECRAMDLPIEGLMCIPPINESPTKHYQMIIDLTKECGLGRPSIGMSSDYQQALEFEPKYIRLGTILFGKRA